MPVTPIDKTVEKTAKKLKIVNQAAPVKTRDLVSDTTKSMYKKQRAQTPLDKRAFFPTWLFQTSENDKNPLPILK